jgi:hypothetical protein
MIRKNKKAAIELSMGTIVILVLAMTMLILGLVLIRTIFTGAKYNVETINTKVEGEINKLFSEDKKMVIYLADNQASMNPGETYGVAFGVKNNIRGTDEAPKFKYTVSFDQSSCKTLKEKEAMAWIKLGSSSDGITVPYNEMKAWIIRFEIPESAPGCMVRYNIEVKNNADVYTSESFDVNIISTSS